jgi:hypothetical protein
MSLTAAQALDTRRFCGYSVQAAVGIGDPDTVQNSAALDRLLGQLTADQETVLTTVYLANLYQLEAAIMGASANLDTEKAAVWTHNQNELSDRQALYFSWRQQLANFLGVPAGPGVYAPTSLTSGGIVPAVFAV